MSTGGTISRARLAQGGRRAFRRPGTTSRSKYGAIPTVIEGRRFASKAEAARYSELVLLMKAGQIRGLMVQPGFDLGVPSPEGGLPHRIGRYVADFAYKIQTATGWAVVIEDVKGVATSLYKWKKKHVEAQYGITVQEIHRGRPGPERPRRC